jgi:hypothetical protein
MAWMEEPVDAWPCKKTFSPTPEEELRKDMMEGVCEVLQGEKKLPETGDQFPSARRGGIDGLIMVYGYVIAAVYKWRKKTGAQGPVIINPIEEGRHRIDYPMVECLRAGELYLQELAQKGMGISNAKMLATDMLTEEDGLGQKRKLITVGSGAVNQIAGVCRTRELPVLKAVHPMAKLYMRKAHERGHEGKVSTLHRSRREFGS